jgi:hypothetical protein
MESCSSGAKSGNQKRQYQLHVPFARNELHARVQEVARTLTNKIQYDDETKICKVLENKIKNTGDSKIIKLGLKALLYTLATVNRPANAMYTSLGSQIDILDWKDIEIAAGCSWNRLYLYCYFYVSCH